MSRGAQQAMFFLGLPDLKKLCCVTLTLQEDREELRSKQIQTCRELVLLYPDILASPALDSFTEITAVMAILFYQKGIVQVFGKRRGLQLGSPQCVFPGLLQCCLSYSLISRLSPSWNKAGLYLVTGKDFLTETGRLNAVSMELNTCEGQLCISVEANTIRLPAATLEDFDLPPLVLRRFCSDPDSVLDPTSTGGVMWCHILPSMKKGQIITISRKLPRDGPFGTYRDLQDHWNRLYGYRLPDLAEEEVVYCSVYFRLVGERLFTYPLSCIRLQPLQRCPRVDLQGVLGSFLSDVRDRMQSVCGFPARLTSKPCYHTVSLNTAATVQVLSGEQVNLSSSSSIRPILPQLPPRPPRPFRPNFGSQPPALAPLSQQDGAQGLLGNGFRSSQVCRGDGDWPSSSSSSSSAGVSFCFSESSGYQSASSFSSSSSLPLLQSASSFSSSSSLPLLQPASSFSSSSSLPLFQPASSFSSSSSLSLLQPASSPTTASSSLSSSILSPLPPPYQTPGIPPPKLVPIFKNYNPSHHINVALLQVQKQMEHVNGGWEERGRVSLPALKETPAGPPPPPPPPSSYVSSLPSIPHFNRRHKPYSGAAPQPSAHPLIKHVPSLSPASKSKPGIILAPKLESKFHFKSCLKSSVKQSSESKTVTTSSSEGQEAPSAAAAPTSSETKDPSSSRSRKGVKFESKGKKSRSAVKDVDVEKMARSNQLSKLSSAALLTWLRGRGAHISAKHKKEELILKVMGCLAEA